MAAAALSGRADRLLFLMNMQLSDGPSRGLSAPLFEALILGVTLWYVTVKTPTAIREAKKGYISPFACAAGLKGG